MKSKNIVDWHSKSSEEILKILKTGLDGLSTDEVNKRLKTYGENKLPVGKRITLLEIFIHQILSPFVIILIVAAIISLVIGDAKDALFIFIVIFINSIIGTYQEYNAEKSANSLLQIMKLKAKVIRNKREVLVPSEELVPGDLILLESGLKVPADIRLLECSELEIDESLLTGESTPINKNSTLLPKDTLLADRINMAFAGSTVLKGRGIGIVVETGLNTEVGKISKDINETISGKPPLVVRMENFTKQISIFVVITSVVLAIVLFIKGMEFYTIFFSIIALAVAAIPEGLPVALTVALSIASRKMAARNVIVRRLSFVESLGSCTMIASDKTGTLTLNEQTAKLIYLTDGSTYTIEGVGYNGEGKVLSSNGELITLNSNSEIDQIAQIAAFANEGLLLKENKQWVYHGDSMDVALLGMCYKLGFLPYQELQKITILGRIPYESERKFSAVFFIKNNSTQVAVKGAVETVLEFCSQMSINSHLVPLNKDKILKDAEKLAQNGYRVLAFAGANINHLERKEKYDITDFPPLVYYGMIGFIDPLRPEAKISVKKCMEAGIKVIMITGDHPATAGAIARELGIAKNTTPIITGKILNSLANNSVELEKTILNSTVFARITPSQKLQVIDVLIRNGEFVAVTGDGVNDAPALKRANIGVAMGSGTDVAKETASMIIADDNFASIVAGIEEGRIAYDNVRKVIYLLIATGLGEIILFIASIAANLPLPLLPVQLLWLNLVTNGIQDVALAFEGGEPDVMKFPPRNPSENIFNSLMIKETLLSGATIGFVSFGYWYYLNHYTTFSESYIRNLILFLIVFMVNFHVLNARSERYSIFKIPLKRNYFLVFGVIIAQLIHIISMHLPFMQNVLQISPISIRDWMMSLLLSSCIILVMEIFKYLNRKFS